MCCIRTCTNIICTNSVLQDTKEQWYKILDFDPISGCKGGGLVGALKCAMFKVAVNICRASALGIKRTAEEKACEYMEATAGTNYDENLHVFAANKS